MSHRVFLSGGTGYMGRELTRLLISRGHTVSVLARPGSEDKVIAGAQTVMGNALDAETLQRSISAGDTLVHLVGVAHPAPWKERAFRAIDLASFRASLAAARARQAAHFVYVSVAQPAPVMKAYQRVRKECEWTLSSSGIPSTILRPWYVLGPGHWWPIALRPVYSLLEAIPATREPALRLGLVTRAQMIAALAWAVENPPEKTQILGVPDIRSQGSKPAPASIGAAV